MSMDEKQWLVSRLDVAHETIFGELQLTRDDYIRIREDVKSGFMYVRNAILSGVVVVLAILTVLHETNWITDKEIILKLLISDLIVGFVTFIVFHKIMSSNTNAFIRVENSIVHAQKNLNHNYGFLIEKTFNLNNVTMQTLRDYIDCMASLSGIVLIPFRNSLNMSSKHKLLVPYYKKLFKEYAIGFEQTIDPSISLFTKMNKQNLPLQTVQYIQTTIPEYKKENHTLKK